MQNGSSFLFFIDFLRKGRYNKIKIICHTKRKDRGEKMIHSFLMIGQSNMAGRGFPSEVEPLPKNDNIYVMRNGRWWPKYVPVNPDRVTAGVSLIETFAEEYSRDHKDVQIGIIPCADGGTAIEAWEEGGVLFDNAVNMCRLALRTSTIAGILWHQGESNVNRREGYREKFLKMKKALTDKLDLHDVPFIAGGLGDFLVNYKEGAFVDYYRINDIYKELSRTEPMLGFASAEGLTANPDNLHFNAASLREFGVRYYEVFKTLERKDKVFVEKGSTADALKVREMERL